MTDAEYLEIIAVLNAELEGLMLTMMRGQLPVTWESVAERYAGFLAKLEEIEWLGVAAAPRQSV